MVTIPHPVQYQGSKRNLAPHILGLMPRKIDRLIEPFAGTGAISIAAAVKQQSCKFWLNDLNQPLISLLKLIVEQPDEIADAYAAIWNEQHSDSVGHYLYVRDQFNQTKDPKLFLYLLARCVKGAVRYNSLGLFNQSPDKRRKGTLPATMRKNIKGVSHLLKGNCNFTALDYREVLDRVQKNDFVYMDPPYQGVCARKDTRYFSGIDFDDFVLAIENLKRKGISFVISYDGRLGTKTFGQTLPKSLGLQKIEIEVGLSSQATLLGRKELTVESLYLSNRQSSQSSLGYTVEKPKQLVLLDSHEKSPAVAR
jgi:DNA adenine methylase